MSDYRKLSDEEIQEASNTNLVDFLTSIGEKVERRGRNFFWTSGGHDTLAIFGQNYNLFKHFSTGDEAKNAIKFCQEYLNMSFGESVEALLSGRTITNTTTPIYKKVRVEKTKFVMPERSNHTKQLLKYLVHERGLNKEVISEFINLGTLYQTKEFTATGKPYSNIAFLIKDFKNNSVGAIKRSLLPNGFKGNHKNSDMQYSFSYIGGSKRLFVFEAPIDMLSYISFMKQKELSKGIKDNKWKNDNFMALGGVVVNPVLNYINKNPNIETLYLCHDTDSSGLKVRINTLEKLKEAGFKGNIYCHFPKYKDWNEDLLNNIKSDDLYNLDKESLVSLLKGLQYLEIKRSQDNINGTRVAEKKPKANIIR